MAIVLEHWLGGKRSLFCKLLPLGARLIPILDGTRIQVLCWWLRWIHLIWVCAFDSLSSNQCILLRGHNAWPLSDWKTGIFRNTRWGNSFIYETRSPETSCPTFPKWRWLLWQGFILVWIVVKCLCNVVSRNWVIFHSASPTRSYVSDRAMLIWELLRVWVAIPVISMCVLPTCIFCTPFGRLLGSILLWIKIEWLLLAPVGVAIAQSTGLPLFENNFILFFCFPLLGAWLNQGSFWRFRLGQTLLTCCLPKDGIVVL